MDLIERDGFWWPADDTWCHTVIHEEVDDLLAAVSLAKGRDVAVQAGGNVGVWATHLATMFERVETVEPYIVNYECLKRNVPANVNHRHAGFGHVAGYIGLVTVPGNAGAHYVQGDGANLVITIDSLNLDACDLICLDVEGYEPLALRGAAETIRKHRPVIMFEEKGLSHQYYGIPKGTSEHWLLGLGLGYEVAHRVRKDVIMSCK
jgi:FkbM family methyltransferase